MPEQYWYIKRCDLFEQLSDSELRTLERSGRRRDFPRGTTIYLPSDPADGVLLLTSGRAKICSFSSDGKQVILAFVEPGELFGELALLGETDRDEHAEAVEKSSVVFIPAHVLQQLIEQNPRLAFGVTKMLGLRRRRVERRLKYLLFRSNLDRLVHLLLELTEQYGERTADGIQLRIKLSHQDLASIIGSTRETVTTMLGKLQADGALKLGRRTIVIRDLEQLSASIQAPRPPLVGKQS